MNPFTDKVIREFTSIVLQIIREKHQGDHPFALSLEILDEIMSDLTRQRRIVRRNIRQGFRKEMLICYVLVAAVGWLSFIIKKSDKADGVLLFPDDWLADPRALNPNMIVYCQLTQIANHGLAALRLLEDGLENPAGVVVRTLIESSLQLIVFSSDREAFRQYAVAQTPEELKKLWYNLLSSKKLIERIELVGSALKLEPGFFDFMKNQYAIYSEFVHPSSRILLTGSFEQVLESEAVRPVLFGNVTALSKYMVRSVADMLCIVMVSYPQILAILHGFSFPEADRGYQIYRALQEFGLTVTAQAYQQGNHALVQSR